MRLRNFNLILFVFLFIIFNSFFAYAVIGDEFNPGESCLHIKLNLGSNAQSGVYWVDPDGTGGYVKRQVYCDMVTDDGGWMLVEAYHHPAGDIDLRISADIWPLNLEGNSHVDSLANYGFSFPHINEVMLYCTSSGSGKTIHYINRNLNVRKSIYDNSVRAGCIDLKSGITLLADHTSLNLPLNCQASSVPDDTRLFGYQFPMQDRIGRSYNWAIDGSAGISIHRWECDDYTPLNEEGRYETYHQVYIRGSQIGAYDCKLLDIGTQPEPGYKKTSIYFQGQNIYNGHLSLGSAESNKEFYCPVDTGSNVIANAYGQDNIDFLKVSCKNIGDPISNCHAYTLESGIGDQLLSFLPTSQVLQCYSTSGECDVGDMCLMKLSSQINAHIASCEYDGQDYNVRLCCKFGPPPVCGNGFIETGEDCDCGDPWDCYDGLDEGDLNGLSCHQIDPDRYGGILGCYIPGYISGDQCKFDLSSCGYPEDPFSYYVLGECICPQGQVCDDAVGQQTKTIFVWDGAQYVPQPQQETLSCFLQLNEPIILTSLWLFVFAFLVLVGYYLIQNNLFRNIFK